MFFRPPPLNSKRFLEICNNENILPIHCPKCKGEDLTFYIATFECKKGKQIFLIKELELFDDDDDILSMEEKKNYNRGL